MSNSDLSSLLFVLLSLVGLAQLLGYAFTRLQQPRVAGEILAGVLLGPALLGKIQVYGATFVSLSHRHSVILDFVYWLGLLLLMFLSGAEMRELFTRTERRDVSWLAVVGTGLPFVVGLALGPWLAGPAIAGPSGTTVSLVIILAVSVAVTSVPVISKIFTDLRILGTRFARLVLGVAVLEDIVLWAALALALSLAGKATLNPWHIAYHLTATVAFFGLGLTILPRAVKRFNKSRVNVLAKHAPVSYTMAVLFAYCVFAGALDINMVFAAFLAGFAVVHKKRKLFASSLEAIGSVSFAFFVPVYFALVGLKLNLTKGFSWKLLVVFLVGSCAIKIISVCLAGKLAGFRGLALVNLSLATNARGGPGIVLASVAFDAGLINAAFYTTLVLSAVVTSQIAGVWLGFVLRRGWPLLDEQMAEVGTPVFPRPESQVPAA